MIGLLDYDWFNQSFKNRLVPNLEIMKLATYYRVEEKTFCRLLSLDETELEGYSQIFFFSEIAENPIIPPAFLRAKNVIYGGTAFTKGKYIPFENQIIDYTIAKPTIYKEFLKQKYQDGIQAKTISHVLDDSYYRLHADGNLLPVPPVMSRQRVILFDRDFFVPGWQEIIKKISERKPSTIMPIHPVFCHKMSDFLDLRELNKFQRTALIILDLDIPLDESYYMLKRYKNKLKADIMMTSNVCLALGGDFQFDQQYFKDFIYKLNLLYVFWSAGIPIKIKYFNSNSIYNNPISNLEKLVETWAMNTSKETLCLNDRIHHRNSKEVKENTQLEKDLLLENYPSARDLFDQTYDKIKDRGYWRV